MTKPRLTLAGLPPKTLFRMAGDPCRTGLLVQASAGSAVVEWHTLYQIMRKNGRNKPVIRTQGDMMIVAPGTQVCPIEDAVEDWGDVPTIDGVPMVRSVADFAKLGWAIEGVKIVNNRPQQVAIEKIRE